MSGKTYALGIDLGTGSCKTVLVGADGVVASTITVEYDTAADESMNPMAWWSAVASSVRRCCRLGNITPAQIIVVACTGQMQGCTFLDATGAPTRNSLGWWDSAGLREARVLNQSHREAFLRNSTHPAFSSFMGSKIRWAMANDPEAWARTEHVLFAPSFISYMLTGVLSADPSQLGFSGLNNFDDDSWSLELIAATGIVGTELPELRDSDRKIGAVSSAAARMTGLAEGTCVITGAGDVAAECFAVSLESTSELKLRLGSAGAVNAVIPRDVVRRERRAAIPYLRNDTAIIGEYLSACGMALKWARAVLYSDGTDRRSTYSRMDREAAQSAPGSAGIRFLPHSFAARDSLGAEPAITGIAPGCRRGDVVHAIYEGTAFAIRSMIESDSILAHTTCTILCGGGARSTVWGSCMASILGRDLLVPRESDAAYGIALMAAESIDLLDAKDAASRSRSAGHTISSNASDHALYEPLYREYLSTTATARAESSRDR